jgi:hypothetical protein
MIDIPFSKQIVDAAGIMGILFLLSLMGNIYFLRKIFKDNDKWAILLEKTTGQLTVAIKDGETSNTNTQATIGNFQRAIEALTNVIIQKK